MASMEIFPDHIISEILVRTETDPKHLCSLKLVSKRWNSVLTTPHFISTYITRLRRTLQPSWVVLDKVLRVTYESTIESTHFDSTPPPSISSFRVPPHCLFPDPTRQLDISRYRIPSIIGSSNGLILFAVKFSSENDDGLYVANPVTNQWAPVPNPSDELDRKALGFAVGVSSWGVVDRVVVVEFTRVGLRYFSSDYGKWVFKVTNFTHGTQHCRHDGAFEFDGSLFWIDLSSGLVVWDRPFDRIGDDSDDVVELRFIKLPIKFWKDSDVFDAMVEIKRVVGVSNGSVYFVETNYEGDCLVSKLVDYKCDGGKWSLMHRISFQDVWSHKSYSEFGLEEKRLSPSFIHPFEPDVVVFESESRNVEVNVKAKRVVRCSDPHLLMVGSFCVFSVGSFVIPTWPVVLPSRLCAALAKEQGNVYMKAEQFHEAIFWYSKSIAVAPSPASYADRALAYSKVDMLNEAENDYTQALTLDNEYFKVHGRPASTSWVILDKVVRVNLEPTAELTKFERTSPPNVSTFCVAPYRLVAKPAELETSRHKFPSIIASSKGLVLFAIKFIGQEDRQFVANPVTDEWAPIVNPHQHSLYRKGVGFVAKVDSSGVLEKFVVAEYRVLGSRHASLMCFSSASAIWVEKSANYMLGKRNWRYDGAFEFDGNLFWTDLGIGLIMWDDPIGGVEDAKERVLCRFIRFPIMFWRETDEFDSMVEIKRVVGVSNGSVYFVETNYEGDCLVSKLMDYKCDGGEWSLMHRISLQDVWSHKSYSRFGLKEKRLSPSFIHPFEPDVVVFETEGRNVVVNVRGKRVVSCSDPHILMVGSFCIFSVGSFVIPPGPVVLPSRLSAALAKEQGNAYLKAEQFHEAIFWYSKSIAVAPSPASYADRALAYSKVDMFNEAENDYTQALTLDNEYFKVHGRPASPSWCILDKIVRVNLEPTAELTKFERTSPPNVSTFRVAPYRLTAKPAELDIDRQKIPSIIASCDGLILFAIKFIGQEDTQFIANPVTDEWAPILNPHRHSLNRKGVGFVARVDSSGVLKKYLVAEYRAVGSSHASLMCFSSDSAEWVEKSANYMLGKYKWRYDGAFEFDGSLFWIDLSIGLITWDDPIGGVEDAKERVLCRFIQFPIMFWRETDEVECKRVVGVSGGSIHFVETNDGGDCFVSILKNNKGDEQWTIIHKLSFQDLWSHDSYAGLGLEERRLTPSFIHPFNSDVVVFETESRNVAVNIRTRKTESCSDPHLLLVGTFLIFSVGSFVVPPQPTLLPASLCSALSKAQGNEYFKAKQYHEAIFWYCNSIDVAPSPAAYANRALANLKVNRFNEAENDCTEALVLDGDNFKVYGRRAVARKELGNLEGSLADLQSALNLQPQNAELKKQYAEILSLLKKASISRRT